MASIFRLIWLLAIILPFTALLAPVQLVLNLISPRRSRRIPVIWHRFVLYLLSVRVLVHGEMAGNRPLMLVSNHVSWADIMVLGSVGELCFIAKDEVKSWPGINWLARLQRSVFVNRDRRRDAGIQADTIARRLLDGDVMVLFAEGTTGNGDRLLPFKSALFGAPQAALAQSGLDQVLIQPVAITYSALHGMPLGRYHQSLAAWPGDIPLGRHLKNFLMRGAFDVDVSFGAALPIDGETKRKVVADETYRSVRAMFADMRRLHHRAERKSAEHSSRTVRRTRI